MYSVTLGKGSDIVFLHGWGGDVSAFLYFAERMAPRYRCTLVDMYGFGKTPEPERALSVSDYADGIAALMTEKGLAPAVIVGHSFGGRVAMELAAKRPELVSAMVLVDSAGLKPRRGLRYYFRVLAHKLLRKLGMKGLKGSSDYRKLSPVMRETFKKVVNYDQTPLLSSIACPTAVFWGKTDTDTPPYMAKRLIRGIRDSHIFWLEGGHFAYLFNSAEFMSVLCAFIDGVGRPHTGGEVIVRELPGKRGNKL